MSNFRQYQFAVPTLPKGDYDLIKAIRDKYGLSWRQTVVLCIQVTKRVLERNDPATETATQNLIDEVARRCT